MPFLRGEFGPIFQRWDGDDARNVLEMGFCDHCGYHNFNLSFFAGLKNGSQNYHG